MQLAPNLVEAIDQVERVTGKFGHIGDPPPHIHPHLPVDLAKPVEARVLVRQGGAHPCLRVAHLPPECAAASADVLELRQRLAQLVHRVTDLQLQS